MLDKKIIRLKESELISLVKKIINNLLKEEYNNSIHNWELYQSVKKNKTNITNKLNIVNENKEEKLKNLFDSMMRRYENLVEVQREYEDFETADIYQAYVYYVDPEIDWEDDEYVFKVVIDENDPNGYNLEYHAYMLYSVTLTFGRPIFNRLLKSWFEKHYRLKISDISFV